MDAGVGVVRRTVSEYMTSVTFASHAMHDTMDIRPLISTEDVERYLS